MEIDVVIERLAFIKSLYNVGVEQSRKAEPFCWASVLTFHDAIEFFLALSSQYLDLGIQIENMKFMGYWPSLSEKLAEKGMNELTQKISIEKLNKARVDFKHYGNPPSQSAIEDFRASSTNFFEENTPLVFGIEFSDVSLIKLVKCPDVKNSLKEAEENSKANKTEESFDKAAIAFAQLIDDYENRKRDEFGRSPFFFGKSMTFMDAFSFDIKGELGDFVDAVGDSIEAIQESENP